MVKDFSTSYLPIFRHFLVSICLSIELDTDSHFYTLWYFVRISTELDTMYSCKMWRCDHSWVLCDPFIFLVHYTSCLDLVNVGSQQQMSACDSWRIKFWPIIKWWAFSSRKVNLKSSSRMAQRFLRGITYDIMGSKPRQGTCNGYS